MITLILGGARSGKSDLGLTLLQDSPSPWTMIVTGKALDLSFRSQIRTHRRERDPAIRIIESNGELAQLLTQTESRGGSYLVDSLDFWLFHLNQKPESSVAGLVESVQNWSGENLIFVSSEIGLGPVAPTASLRDYIRLLGGLNQKIARISDQVFLCLAGIPVRIK